MSFFKRCMRRSNGEDPVNAELSYIYKEDVEVYIKFLRDLNKARVAKAIAKEKGMARAHVFAMARASVRAKDSPRARFAAPDTPSLVAAAARRNISTEQFFRSRQTFLRGYKFTIKKESVRTRTVKWLKNKVHALV